MSAVASSFTQENLHLIESLTKRPTARTNLSNRDSDRYYSDGFYSQYNTTFTARWFG
ncbi:MAG UNVERIFIED_CONTAM: hypothetical protein LVR29_30700 [Microcystis novacekii LVE1205-3]|jgi:hypothetical protein